MCYSFQITLKCLALYSLFNSIKPKKTSGHTSEQKPKTELVKELKLTTNKELTCCEDLNVEKLVGRLDGINNDSRLPQMDMDHCLRRCGTKRVPVKLLQFDKSNRPAFYGVWPKSRLSLITKNF